MIKNNFEPSIKKPPTISPKTPNILDKKAGGFLLKHCMFPAKTTGAFSEKNRRIGEISFPYPLFQTCIQVFSVQFPLRYGT